MKAAPLLCFDRMAELLHVMSLNGCTTWRACNNVTSTSRGPWPAGIFQPDRLVRLPPGDDDPNGPYGRWFLRYVVPDRDGIDDQLDLFDDGLPDANDGPGVGLGIHAGRRDGKDALGRSGPARATLGCIRTSDEAMTEIIRVIEGSGGLLPVLWIAR